MRKDEKQLTRPTIRIDKEWYAELKGLMKSKDTNFQELSLKLLEEWYENNK